MLYCLRSSNDGFSFPTLTRVFVPPVSGVTYGEVPTATGGWGPGFFRIARVWSCVAPGGRVHVVWMDNRDGRFSGDEPRRDKWRVRRAFSDDKGLTWTVPSDPVSDQPSVGGFGIPQEQPAGEPHVPPGDFLACDADANVFYVAWTDTRYALTDQWNAKGPRVFFRRYVK